MSEPTMRIRKVIVRHDDRTAAQVDAHVHARLGALERRLADRPAVRPAATHIEARIDAHGKSFRMRRPEAPGT